MALATLDWMTQDAERLAQCNHDHPQAVLGPQQLEDGRSAGDYGIKAESTFHLVQGMNYPESMARFQPPVPKP